MIKSNSSAGETDVQQCVLFVDHEVLIRILVCEYLRQCGFRVIEAANTEEAIIVLSEPDLTVDLVFLNVELSGTADGFALARWMRSHRPHLPLILAGTPARAADAAAELCASGPLLERPYDPQTLLDRIRRSLSSGTSDRNGAADLDLAHV